ncbi:MAG TPA: hypothetical protein G4O11_06130 [Anaerolineae bacterium]|nr:hypothetical protein [Anaerolineae bacterium]
MQRNHRKRNLVVFTALVMSAFAIPHLIDDFLFGIPEEFGLTNQSSQALGGIFTFIPILSIVLAARNLKAGYYACLSLGLFLALAGILKHIPRMIAPGPYWSGWFSEFLIYGLIASGLILAGVSISAIRKYEA